MYGDGFTVRSARYTSKGSSPRRAVHRYVLELKEPEKQQRREDFAGNS